MRLFRFSLLRRFQIPALSLSGAAAAAGSAPWRPLPLPITATAILVLVALPLVALQRLPRPRAQGLEQLLNGVTLLQSFPAAPQRAIPDLWRQRLGAPLAERAWRQQRGLWWQLWGEHADGAPMLALPAASLPAATVAALPPQAMRLGDLVVVAPDPLALQMLRDGLRPQQRPSRGLQRRCLDRLRSTQAVFWNSAAIGVIAGPMAPLLQRFQDGCLSIALDATGVVWSGEAAAVDGVLTSVAASPSWIEPPRHGPLPPDQLLQIEGASLDLLIQGLLSRQMIRDPLASRYGIDTDRLELLRRAPFQLRLRPRLQGPFQASLELQLLAGKDRAAWQQLLDRLSRSLQEQGLRPAVQAGSPASSAASSPSPGGSSPAGSRPAGSRLQPATIATPRGAGGGTLSSSAIWSRADGVIVGGWRWLPAGSGQAQLLFFLGPVPQAPLAPIGGSANPLPAAGGLLLRSRPAALAALEMLPADVPELMRRSSQLEIEARLAGDQSLPISLLTGRLQVTR